MKHVLIAADKFKGSLSTFQACQHIANGVQLADPGLGVQLFPVADGGDGFQQVMQYYLHTQTIFCETLDPLHRPMRASYQLDVKNKTAIIEMAVASGLVLLDETEKNPMITSTLGTGMLIKDAIDKGCTSIMLGLGGSATNDAGTGILQALGFIFLDQNGSKLNACGESLSRIHTIIMPGKVNQVQFIIATDVQHVLHGRAGAAFVFAAQKGATEAMIRNLDEGLVHFSNIIREHTGKNIDQAPGTGAAGGIAAGLMAFFPVEIRSGFDLVAKAGRMKQFMQSADLVITGEGRMDEQTLSGKVIAGVLAFAQEAGKPVIVCCGENTLDHTLLKAKGVIATYSLAERTANLDDAMRNAGSVLEATAVAAIRWFINQPED